jgi:integrase
MNPWQLSPTRALDRWAARRLRERARQKYEAGLRLGRRLDVRNGALLITLLDSGLRASELGALQVQDVAIERGQRYLHVRHGKGGRKRIVVLGDRLRGVLRTGVIYDPVPPGWNPVPVPFLIDNQSRKN